MNNFQIDVLMLSVGCLLFFLVGIEIEGLKRNVNKLTNALRATLIEFDRRLK